MRQRQPSILLVMRNGLRIQSRLAVGTGTRSGASSDFWQYSSSCNKSANTSDGQSHDPADVVSFSFTVELASSARDSATHPSITKASTVRPSAAPGRSLLTSSLDPKVASKRPASLTLATRLGTAALIYQLRSQGESVTYQSGRF